MSKGKLQKFADMRTYDNVFEWPYGRATAEPFPIKGSWRDDYFHNDRPIVLELGCGRGEYTVGMARRFPQKNFIGVDIKGARMWSGATEAQRDGLANVAFLRTNIEIINLFFGPNEVEEIWLTFSDPQMKRAKKRLTSTWFLRRYRHILVDGGLIHVKTDSNFLFTYTALMAETNGLPVLFKTNDLYHTDGIDAATAAILGIRTYYESQWIERGMTIKYMKFTLPATGTLAEPDVDIPVDDYRSYKRARRSSLVTSR